MSTPATRPAVDVLAHASVEPPAYAATRLALVESREPGERARRMIREARAISLEHLAAVADALTAAQGLLRAVVDSGDLYTPALVDFAGKLGEDLFWKSKTLGVFAERQRELSGF